MIKILHGTYFISQYFTRRTMGHRDGLFSSVNITRLNFFLGLVSVDIIQDRCQFRGSALAFSCIYIEPSLTNILQ